MQCLIIEQSVFGHFADLHVMEPVIDHIVTGHVPQVVIASLTAFVMTEACVEIFMRQYEFPFLLCQSAGGVRIDFTVNRIHGSDMYFILMTQINIFDNPE